MSREKKEHREATGRIELACDPKKGRAGLDYFPPGQDYSVNILDIPPPTASMFATKAVAG
jgi:hypothetical protein